MCCIILAISSKPDLSLIQKIHARNSDGISVSWLDEKDKLAHYKKGLFPFEANKFIESLDLPFVVHFRAASIGMSKSNLLCHPFEVTEKSELKLEGVANQLLIHNGTIGSWKVLLATADLPDIEYCEASDTRAIAIILNKLKDINKQERFLKILNGKFILMDTERWKFKTFGNFFQENDYPGMEFSNLEWKNQTIYAGYAGNFHHLNSGQNFYNDDDYCVSDVSDLSSKKKTQKIEYKVIDKRNGKENDKENTLSQFTPEEKLTYNKHVEYQKSLDGSEKSFCCRCALQLTIIRTMYLHRMGVPKMEMKCVPCERESKNTRTTVLVNPVINPVINSEIKSANSENYAG